MKLSICITTLNRAALISETLESILDQLTDECELVVLDGGSTDGTENVVSGYLQRFPQLRYIRHTENHGLDRDYDTAVQAARGEYCWLMTDDDLLKPGAISTILKVLSCSDLSLVVVNVESRSLDMSETLQPRWLNVFEDRIYQGHELDRLFADVCDAMRYIGCVVIERALWLERDREKYFGSLFMYVGVIFQKPLKKKMRVIAEPLISYREGNTHTFSPQVVKVVWLNWPAMIASLALSDDTKCKICLAEPWKNLHELLHWRALGLYAMAEYERWVRPRLRHAHEALLPTMVALLPGVLLNSMFLLYYTVGGRPYRGIWGPKVMVQALKDARCRLRNRQRSVN